MAYSAIRIVECVEEVIVYPSKQDHRLEITGGHTLLIEREEEERIVEIDVMPTPITKRIQVDGGTAKIKLYAIQAILVTDEVDVDAIQVALTEQASERARAQITEGVGVNNTKRIPSPPDPPQSDEDRPVA